MRQVLTELELLGATLRRVEGELARLGEGQRSLRRELLQELRAAIPKRGSSHGRAAGAAERPFAASSEEGGLSRQTTFRRQMSPDGSRMEGGFSRHTTPGGSRVEPGALLVISDDPAVLGAVTARAASYSCAVGGKDLSGALDPLRKALLLVKEEALQHGNAAPPAAPLYACENDHDAVDSLAVELHGLVEVVPVLVDRVCSEREIRDDGSVDVTTEPYAGDLVLTPPGELSTARPPIPFGGSQVRQPQTHEGAAFLHRKKILSVNGTHTTIAFLTLLAAELPDHVGPPSGSHELLAFDVADMRTGRRDGAARMTWVWVVARQLMLLYEFDETVVRHTLLLGAEAQDDGALVATLLAGAQTAVERLSRGGDQTARVLGGGVENRWRTRLANVHEFLEAHGTRGHLSRRLLFEAGVTEVELRTTVEKLVRDSKRFVMVGRQPGSPSRPSPDRSRMSPLRHWRDLPERKGTPGRQPRSPQRTGSGLRLRFSPGGSTPGRKTVSQDFELPSIPPYPMLGEWGEEESGEVPRRTKTTPN